MICDICSESGVGERVALPDMERAVFTNGFNPYESRLITNSALALGVSDAEAYAHWRDVTVGQDSTDWNVCPSCMLTLEHYLNSAATPSPDTTVPSGRVEDSDDSENLLVTDVQNMEPLGIKGITITLKPSGDRRLEKSDWFRLIGSGTTGQVADIVTASDVAGAGEIHFTDPADDPTFTILVKDMDVRQVEIGNLLEPLAGREPSDVAMPATSRIPVAALIVAAFLLLDVVRNLIRTDFNIVWAIKAYFTQLSGAIFLAVNLLLIWGLRYMHRWAWWLGLAAGAYVLLRNSYFISFLIRHEVPATPLVFTSLAINLAFSVALLVVLVRHRAS